MVFNPILTLLAAVAVLVVGQQAVRHIGFLRTFNIPVPVVGGLIATVIVTLLRTLGIELSFYGGL